MTTTALMEHKWTTVKLGGNRGHSTAGSAQNGYDMTWFNMFTSVEGDRRSLLTKFDMMDRRSIETSRAIDIIAEDMSSSNADDEDIFYLDFDEDSKMKKTHIKSLNFLLETWCNRTGFEMSLFDYSRQMIKYGGVFFVKKPDGSLKYISPERLVGYILSPEDDELVTHYIVDWEAPYINLKETHRRIENANPNAKKKEYDIISIEDMLIIKRGKSPFGESLLDRAYPIWRKLDLLETAVVIHRFTRSIDRKAFYIDVGRLPEVRHKEVIDKYRLQMRQKRVMTGDGDVSTEFDPHSMTEDYFIPVTGQGRSARIETVNGSPSSGELNDLTYLARKLAAALRVPPSMTDTHNEGNDRDAYSDMRVGQVYQVEMRYLGFVNRDKRKMEEALQGHFSWFVRKRGVEAPEEMALKINESHNFALYKNIETYQSLINVFQSVNQVQNLSKKFAMRKYLALDEEELIKNEHLMLIEKGLTEDVIIDMTEEEVANIVYGDGRLGANYGIKADEGGAGGWR